MALRNPAGVFGIHQATIIDRATGVMNTLRVLGDPEGDFKQEQVPLQGGSSAYPWNTAPGYAEASYNLTVKQYDLAALKYFAGTGANSFTEDLTGDASGDVSALTNIVGSSVFNATTGIASAGVEGGGNPKYGDYTVEAVTATTVHVNLNNNLDGVAYQNDNLRITASPLTIASGAPVTVPGTNLQLTGGSGTIALGTAGNMAKFSVRPQNSYNYQYRGGADGSSFPEFGLYIFFEKLDDNQYRALYMPRVKGNGVSFKGAQKDWAEFESELMVLHDSAKGFAWEFQVINV